MRLHYLQHVALETPGSILTWAEKRGHEVSHTLLHEGEALPGLDAFDWLVIMGGPMGVHDEDICSWLPQEKRLIGEAIAAGKVVLGFCLGSQLIAEVIGGHVTTNGQPETGWQWIRWSVDARQNPLFSFFPEKCMVFQWHNDTFSMLPPEAKLLASSDVCKHQAFIYREWVLGFQFHLENTAEMVRVMYAESTGSPRSPEEARADEEHAAENNRWMSELLTRLEMRWA